MADVQHDFEGELLEVLEAFVEVPFGQLGGFADGPDLEVGNSDLGNGIGARFDEHSTPSAATALLAHAGEAVRPPAVAL
jgi:hypothetical protein